MGTISSAFSLIAGAINANQSALSIVANNVANANTPGYTEETPNWQENVPVNINGRYYGAGVSETGATSMRDRVLAERLNQQQQLASASTSRMAALNSIQALFTPNSGSASSGAGDIGHDITSFFDSFSKLEANAGNNALRQQVLSTATTLAGDISNAANSLNAQQSSLDREAAGVIVQVNALTSAIAQLNHQIQSTSPNADAGVLEDQRQQDLGKLSQLVGINQIATENNGLSITTTSGQMLVSEDSNYPMTAGLVNGVTHFFVGTTDITSQLVTGGGSLGGYLTARDQDIPQVLSALDQLAFAISTQVNAVNNAGTGYGGVQGTGTNSSGTPGTGTIPMYIFKEPTQMQGSAGAIKMIMTDPNQIAAGGFGAGAGSTANAIAMADLINGPLLKPLATSSFSLGQNLDAATAVNGSVASTVQIYDSLGKSYTATVTFTNQGGNAWAYGITISDPLATPVNATGTLHFDASGNLASPLTNVNQISFSGFADGASPLTLTWELYGSNGKGTVTQTAAPSAQSGQSQNGYNFTDKQSPVDFFSNFVTVLGATVSEVQTENTAQNASVTQLQNENNALSAVNLNTEAASLQQLQRSYQAASQVFAILNSIMASVLNMGIQTAVS
jgi:flagellar hook-associated protein 1 FlgK